MTIVKNDIFYEFILLGKFKQNSEGFKETFCFEIGLKKCEKEYVQC